MYNYLHIYIPLDLKKQNNNVYNKLHWFNWYNTRMLKKQWNQIDYKIHFKKANNKFWSQENGQRLN